MARIIENPRQLILNHGKEILYNEGYRKLNMRYLAQTCGIALGTIYNYFPTKAELVAEMMVEYWEEFFRALEKKSQLDGDLYDKLIVVYQELDTFLTTFKAVWLSAELYEKPEYVKHGLEREEQFLEKLVRLVEGLLLKEAEQNADFHLKLSFYETATFIVANFITMIQMPFFKYESFEKFLKELL